MTDITRGASHTFLAGERYHNPDDYYTGSDGADNEGYYNGQDNDNNRDTASVPMQDKPGYIDPGRFGSAHAGGLFMLMCDGSVQFILYGVDLAVWMPAGNRNLDPNFSADPW